MNQDASGLQRVFGRSRVFLPVIHPVRKESALESIWTAVQSGADGVFLINQGMSTAQVLQLIPEVHRLYQHRVAFTAGTRTEPNHKPTP